MHRTVFDAVENPIIVADPEKHMTDIGKINEIFRWYFVGFPQVFTENEK